MRVPRADDVSLLAELAGEGTERWCVLDGAEPAYLVPGGHADLIAVPRRLGTEPVDCYRFLATLGPGTVVPSATVLGAWQLVLAPAAGTRLLPLSAKRLRGVGYGGVGCGDIAGAVPLVPAPRGVSLTGAALARGVDAALLALADALRGGDLPPPCTAIGPGEIMSLDSGTAVKAAGGVSWVRVAGGHARRNGDPAAVFGNGEPALLAGHDWIVVDGPATVEATCTADLLVAGHLPAALDAHATLTLRRIDDRR